MNRFRYAFTGWGCGALAMYVAGTHLTARHALADYRFYRPGGAFDVSEARSYVYECILLKNDGNVYRAALWPFVVIPKIVATVMSIDVEVKVDAG